MILDARKYVLVIDDDREIAEVIAVVLNEEGYEVVSTASGVEGLELARTSLPSVVMLDSRMPEMSGREVLMRFESEEKLRDIPLILMSADHDWLAAESARKHAYLSKPFGVEALIEKVTQATAGATAT